MFADNPKIGFLAHAHKYQAALDKGEVLAPAKSLAQMQQVVFNDYVDATLAFGFILLVVSIVLFGARLLASPGRASSPPRGKRCSPCCRPRLGAMFAQLEKLGNTRSGRQSDGGRA